MDKAASKLETVSTVSCGRPIELACEKKTVKTVADFGMLRYHRAKATVCMRVPEKRLGINSKPISYNDESGPEKRMLVLLRSQQL
jgi:hypothetical protein